MNKSQAIHEFWNSFGVNAYDENTVPPDAEFPYITYSVITDSFEHPVNLSASIWDRNTSWKRVSDLSDEIGTRLNEHGSTLIKLDDGYLWMTQGNPFAQRTNDPDDSIRRIYLNIDTEFLTRT